MSCLLITVILVGMAGTAFPDMLPEGNGSVESEYTNAEPAEAQIESPAMLRGAHQHKTVFYYTSLDEKTHETVEYCPTCDDALGMFTEEHTFEDGECVCCGEPPHNGITDVTTTPIEETIEWTERTTLPTTQLKREYAVRATRSSPRRPCTARTFTRRRTM